MNWSCKLTLWQRERDGGGGQPPVKSQVRAQSNTVGRLRFFGGGRCSRISGWTPEARSHICVCRVPSGLPWWSSGWKSTCQWRGHGSLVREDSHAIKQLSLWTTATEAHAPGACAPKQEMPSQWEARTPQQRAALVHHNERKSMCSNKDPVWPKINTFENRTTPDFKNESSDSN